MIAVVTHWGLLTAAVQPDCPGSKSQIVLGRAYIPWGNTPKIAVRDEG